MRRRLLRAAATTATAVVALGGIRDAAACGGLVAPNGAVRLERATTLAAWHDGVEHYLTSFAYQGDVENVGWIVPLPAVPDAVVKGGSWSLQRLEREAQPPLPQADAGALRFAAAPAPSAQVILKTTIDSLDITVLKGSGQAVVDWSAANNFTLNDETRAHILGYGATSPIFMAARYDTHAARLRGFFQGDGTPVLITMHTPHLWVPLEVLANARDQVKADLFLLTDDRPSVLGLHALRQNQEIAGAPGLRMIKQEEISTSLHDDLVAQPSMAWVPRDGYFTALRLETTGDNVTYDLTAATNRLTLAPMGMGPTAVDKAPPLPGSVAAAMDAEQGIGVGVLIAALSLGGGGLAAGLSVMVVGRLERRRRHTT